VRVAEEFAKERLGVREALALEAKS